MSTFEIPCSLCGDPITSIELDDKGYAMITGEYDDMITSAMHRLCWELEMRYEAAEARRDAMRENFPDWDSR